MHLCKSAAGRASEAIKGRTETSVQASNQWERTHAHPQGVRMSVTRC